MKRVVFSLKTLPDSPEGGFHFCRLIVGDDGERRVDELSVRLVGVGQNADVVRNMIAELPDCLFITPGMLSPAMT